MKRVTESFSRFFAWVLQPLLVFGVLVVGFLGAMSLSSQRDAPPRAETGTYAPLVRTLQVTPSVTPIVVRANGALRARTRIELVPQVGGQVVAIHPELRAGGWFDADEVLVEIESVDYELAVARAHAEVQAAETALVSLNAEAEAAREEWGELHPGTKVPTLVGREPQIREAESRRDAARAAVRSAELDLERTELRLPWAGRVVSASVDVGRVVMANQSVGSVYSTDVFEISVPLRQDQLRWVSFPGDGENVSGTTARATAVIGGAVVELEGRAARLEAELDPVSRLARVVVELHTDDIGPDVATRLLPGLFFDVAFDAGELADVVALPLESVRADGTVWVARDGALQSVAVDVRHRSDGKALVAGLGAGDRVITSELEVVTEGMQVRVENGESDR